MCLDKGGIQGVIFQKIVPVARLLSADMSYSSRSSIRQDSRNEQRKFLGLPEKDYAAKRLNSVCEDSVSKKRRTPDHPLGDVLAQSIAFQERIESVLVLDKEVFVIERTNVDVAVFIISDGGVGRGCGGRDRDDLADGIRNCCVGSEAVIESVEAGETVAEAAEIHAMIKAGKAAEIHFMTEAAEGSVVHAITKAAETVAISERAEAAEAVVIKGMRVGIDRNQSRNRDEDEKRGDLFHCYSPGLFLCYIFSFVFASVCKSVCLCFATALTYQLTHSYLSLLHCVSNISKK